MPGDHQPSVLYLLGSGVDGSDVESGPVSSDEESERSQVVRLDLARVRLFGVTFNLERFINEKQYSFRLKTT
jgi:hypothetical protein